MQDDMRFVESNDYKKSRYPRNAKKCQTPMKGMRKVHMVVSGERKYVDVNYTLIRRFLKKRIGKLWNDVYSEICQHTDFNKSGRMLKEWLDYSIEQNCYIEDGVIFDSKGDKLEAWWHSSFYVHPETQTLEVMESARVRFHKTKQPQTVFELDDVLYYKEDDLWYRVKFEYMPKIKQIKTYSAYSWAPDMFLESSKYPTNWDYDKALTAKYGPGEKGTRYCCWKQSANSREIEKLKIKYPEITV